MGSVAFRGAVGLLLLAVGATMYWMLSDGPQAEDFGVAGPELAAPESARGREGLPHAGRLADPTTTGSDVVRTTEGTPAPVALEEVGADVVQVDVRLLAPDGLPFFDRPSLRAHTAGLVATWALRPFSTLGAPPRTIEPQESPLDVTSAGHFVGIALGPRRPTPESWVFAGNDGDWAVGLLLGNTVIASRFLEPGEKVVEFTLSPEIIAAMIGSVELTVVDAATGEPVEGARAALLQFCCDAARTATSDADGRVRLGGLLPRRHVLRIHAAGYVSAVVLFEASAGQHVDAGLVRMERAQELLVRVMDEQGVPCAAEFRISPATGAPPIPDG